MFTVLSEKENFDKAWRYLKKKDEIAIKKVEKRFSGKDRFSSNFATRVYDVYDAYKLQVPYIVTVLEEYLDNPIYNMWFDIPFSKARVYSVLMDMQFVGMLMCTSLLRRTANLERKSQNQLKLRVYIAILNYDRYKKSQIAKNQCGKRKGKKVALNNEHK